MADKRDRRPPNQPRPGREYEVGYGKPPKSTRFEPGRSGNPKGRRKGSRNRIPALNEERLTLIVLQEAYRDITVTDGGRPVTLSMAEAIIRSMALAAAKGQQRSQRLFTEMLGKIERAHKASHDEYLKAMIEYKIDWEIELERRRRLGIVAPDPIPHPDHIIVDVRAGTAVVRGPITPEEKVKWDKLRARVAGCDEDIADCRTMLASETDEKIRKFLQDQIDFAVRLRTQITDAIGPK